MWRSLKHSVVQFSHDHCLTHAASLAFYALFATAPVLFLLVTVLSFGLSAAYPAEDAEQRAEEFLESQATQLLGDRPEKQLIAQVIRSAEPSDLTWWKYMFSMLGIVVGATGILSALQNSLNRVWSVQPKRRLAWRFVRKRLISFAMIVVFGVLLLASLVASTVLQALSLLIAEQFSVVEFLPRSVNQLVALLTTWMLFFGIFKFVPDARVRWRHAATGATFTVVLFTAGRSLLFYYLSTMTPGKELGSAAASLMFILIWVYYSAIVLLFGAEFTASLSAVAGERVVPDDYAEANPEVSIAAASGVAGTEPFRESSKDDEETRHE